jgi:hypothetical protein
VAALVEEWAAAKGLEDGLEQRKAGLCRLFSWGLSWQCEFFAPAAVMRAGRKIPAGGGVIGTNPALLPSGRIAKSELHEHMQP